MPREREIAAYFRGGKVIPAMIVRWNGKPDSHALIVDVHLQRSQRYVDSLWPVGSVREGMVILTEDQADEARRIIAPFLDSKRGKEMVKNRRQPTPIINDPAPGLGYTSEHDVPLSMRYEALHYYMFIGGAERQAMEYGRRRNPARYHRFLHDRRRDAPPGGHVTINVIDLGALVQSGRVVRRNT
jgi:hypothetical protein